MSSNDRGLLLEPLLLVLLAGILLALSLPINVRGLLLLKPLMLFLLAGETLVLASKIISAKTDDPKVTPLLLSLSLGVVLNVWERRTGTRGGGVFMAWAMLMIPLPVADILVGVSIVLMRRMSPLWAAAAAGDFMAFEPVPVGNLGVSQSLDNLVGVLV